MIKLIKKWIKKRIEKRKTQKYWEEKAEYYNRLL